MSEGKFLLQVAVIDDDVHVRRALIALLGREYDVHAFGNARDALTYLEGGARPFAILVDATMPEMTGLQFLDEHSRDASIASIPLILMTGDDSLRPAGLQGFHACILKPFAADDVLRILRDLAGRPLS